MTQRYLVRAVPWEHGWELHIDGEGVTQTTTLARAGQVVHDYLETLREHDIDDELDIVWSYDLGGLEIEVEQAQHRMMQAQGELYFAAEEMRKVVDRLHHDRSIRDIARIMNLSPARISQLLEQ